MNAYRTSLFAAVGTLLALGASLPATAADSGNGTPAVWEKHQYTLHFMGFTTTYSCDGLEDKVRELLIWAGARNDATSSGTGCDRGFGTPSKFAAAQVTFYTLAPAPAGATDVVSADWHKVQWEPHHPMELGEGDCELVEQFRDQLLPMFTTRAINNRTHCTPHELNPGELQLSFEVLAPSATAK